MVRAFFISALISVPLSMSLKSSPFFHYFAKKYKGFVTFFKIMRTTEYMTTLNLTR